MKRMILLLLPLGLAGCGNDDVVAENAVTPEIAVMSETPGDWSQLGLMVNRTPGESGLLEESPILVDLNAMLGKDAKAFRAAMADSSPLVREGPVLVTRGQGGRGYLVIDPGGYALEAGIRERSGWRRFHTPGAEVPRPPSVRALLQG